MKTNEFGILNIQIIAVSVCILSRFYLTKCEENEESKCKENEFSKPYVLLRGTKDGPILSKLNKRGLLDLRETVRSIVCINGPVIIYKDGDFYEGKASEANKGGDEGTGMHHVSKVSYEKTVKFSNGTFKVFSHSCLPVNWLPKGASPSGRNSNMAFKMAGIFLIAQEAPEEYNNNPEARKKRSDGGNDEGGDSKNENSTTASDQFPVQIMFDQKDYGLKIGKAGGVVMGASFIVSGSGPFCVRLPNEDHIIRLSSLGLNDSEICQWTPNLWERRTDDYKRFFRKALHLSDYKWIECPANLNQQDCGENGNAACESDRITRHNPFATYENPHHAASKFHRKRKKDSHDEEENHKSSEEIFQESSKEAQGPKVFNIQLGNCITLPEFNPNDPSCKSLNSSGKRCPKLAAALELDIGTASDDGAEEDNGAGDDSDPPFFGTMDTISKLHWKHDVLLSIANIFSRICIPIKKQSVYQLMRIISNYLGSVHSHEVISENFAHVVDKTNMWDIIISSLHRCGDSNDTIPMEWEFSGLPTLITPEVSLRRKREILQAPASVPLRNSFDYIVRVDKGYAEANFEVEDVSSEDESEEDYNLEEQEDKLIIQRSPSIFDFEDEDEATNEFILGPIPRWRRTSEEEGKETEAKDLPKVSLPFIQEYLPPSQIGKENAMSHADFIIFPDSEKLRIKGNSKKEIFFHEDLAEVVYDLNPVIDAYWKVLSTTVAYCQKYQKGRINAIYPLAFSNFEEYFLAPLRDEWTKSISHHEARMLLGELGDPDRSQWLDTCLETSYIVGDVLTFRSPRPLLLEDIDEDDRGDDLETKKMKANEFSDIPENHGEPGVNKYFTKEVIMPVGKTSIGVKRKSNRAAKQNQNKTKIF